MKSRASDRFGRHSMRIGRVLAGIAREIPSIFPSLPARATTSPSFRCSARLHRPSTDVSALLIAGDEFWLSALKNTFATAARRVRTCESIVVSRLVSSRGTTIDRFVTRGRA